MTDYETYQRIRLLTNQGLTPAQIASDCHLDERTVRIWQSSPSYRQRASSCRVSKLDDHRQSIVRLLAEHPFSAAQILRKLREDGYTGGYSILKRLVHDLRPPRREAFLPLAFGPGECAQVDWGSAGMITVDGARRRLSFFAMVLCYSRMLYIEFTLLERQEQFLECHQNAFLRFGGVPRRVMIDNLKSAVLSHPRGMPAVCHPRYLDFAAHYGFEIRACQPRRANEKGRVENAVGYVKKNFLAGLNLTSLAAVQSAGRSWTDEVANRRLHAATRRKPDEMFAEEGLSPLPLSGVYDTGAEREAVATSLFRVHYDGNRYSVPARYAGSRVSLRVYTDRVLVYNRDRKLIATHVRAYGRGCDIANPDHGCELVRQRRQARDQHTLQRFLSLCGESADYYRQLSERRANPFEHVRRIAALAEIYGPEKTARAIRDATEFGAYSSEYVANLLEQRERLRPEPGVLHVTRGADLLELDIPETDLSIYEKGNTTP
jgi:transposase